MVVRLLNRVKYSYIDDKILFLCANDVYKIEGFKKSVLDFLAVLQNTGIDDSTISKIYPEYLDLFNFLLNEKLLVKDFRQSPLYSQYSRILHYFESYVYDPVQHLQELFNKKILILGLGGIGSILFQHFLHNGVKQFSLVDYAKVNKTDLNRQYIYTSASLDAFKVDEAKQYGLNLYEDVHINTFTIKIKTASSLQQFLHEGYDLVINACDTPVNIIEILHEFILLARYPFYDASTGQVSGQYGPLIIPNKTLCLQCFTKKQHQTMSCEEQQAKNIQSYPPLGSFGPINSIIASFASLECLHYLSGIKSIQHNTQYYIRFDNHTIDTFSASRLCRCWERKNVH